MAERKTTTLEFVMTTKNGKAFMNWLQSEAAKSSEKMTKLKTDIEGVLQKVKEKDPSIKNKTGLISYQGADKQILAWKKEVLDLDNTLKQTTADLKMFQQAANGIQRQESMFSKAMDGISGMNLKQLRQAAAEYKTMLGNIGKAEKAEHDNAWLKERREIFAAINARIKELEQGMLNARNEAEKFLQTSEKERSETAAQVQLHKENLRVLREENAEHERMVTEAVTKETNALATQKQLESQLKSMKTTRAEADEQIAANQTKITTEQTAISNLESSITTKQQEQEQRAARIAELTTKIANAEKDHAQATAEVAKQNAIIQQKLGHDVKSTNYGADLARLQAAQGAQTRINQYKVNNNLTRQTTQTTAQLETEVAKQEELLGQADALLRQHRQEMDEMEKSGNKPRKTPKAWQDMIAKLSDPLNGVSITAKMRESLSKDEQSLLDSISRQGSRIADKLREVFASREFKNDKTLMNSFEAQFKQILANVDKWKADLAAKLASGEPIYSILAKMNRGMDSKQGLNSMQQVLFGTSTQKGITATPLNQGTFTQQQVTEATAMTTQREAIAKQRETLELRKQFDAEFVAEVQAFAAKEGKAELEFAEQLKLYSSRVNREVATLTTSLGSLQKTVTGRTGKVTVRGITEAETAAATEATQKRAEANVIASQTQEKYVAGLEKEKAALEKNQTATANTLATEQAELKSKQDLVAALGKQNDALDKNAPKAEKIAEVEKQTTEATNQATEATRQREETERKAQAIFDKNAVAIEKEVAELVKVDTIQIKTAEDMQHYISVLKQNAAALDTSSAEYEKHQQVIAKMEVEYSKFIHNVSGNMGELSSKSTPVLLQLRKHFEMVATGVHSTEIEIQAAKAAITSINQQIARNNIADAKSILSPAVAGNNFKNLSTEEVAKNTQILKQNADAAKLNTTERRQLNEQIMKGELYLQKVSNGDNLARMTAQYKYLTKSQQNMSQMSDDAMRKQQQFWLQQSTLVEAGSKKEVEYLSRYRKTTEAINERIARQQRATFEANSASVDKLNQKAVTDLTREEIALTKQVLEHKEYQGKITTAEAQRLADIRRLEFERSAAVKANTAEMQRQADMNRVQQLAATAINKLEKEEFDLVKRTLEYKELMGTITTAEEIRLAGIRALEFERTNKVKERTAAMQQSLNMDLAEEAALKIALGTTADRASVDKQRLELAKQMYTQLVATGQATDTDKQLLKALLAEDQNRLEIARQYTAEATKNANELRAIDIITKGVSIAEKEELDIAKKVYEQKVMTGKASNEERGYLIDILRDEERRLQIQKDLTHEAHNMDYARASQILGNPLAHTAQEVEQATKFAKDYLQVNTQNDQKTKDLAADLEWCTQEQKRFNEESKKTVMTDKLYMAGELGTKALQEQIEYWKKIEQATQGAVNKTVEYSEAVNNRKYAEQQLQANLTDKVGISTMGGAAIQSVAQSNGAATLLQQIQQGSIGSLDKMKEVEAELKVLRGLVDESKAPGAIRLIDEGLAKLKLDMTQLDQNLMSISDAEKRAMEIGVSGPAATTLEVKKLTESLKAGLEYYQKMGDSDDVKRMEKALARVKVQADKLGISTKAIGDAAKNASLSEEEMARIIANPKKELSLKKLKEAYNQLKSSIDTATDSQKRYLEVAGDLRKLDAQILHVQQNIHKNENGLQKFLQGVKSYAMFYFGTMAIMMRIQSVISGNKQLSDSMANVGKVTGATNQEMIQLVRNVQSINTRTATEELMKMAEQAGKLGIYTREGAKGVEDFVRVADKITMTLGEDIGGAEAVGDLVKLNDLVGEKGGLGESMEKLGSAILSVGNNSAASYAQVVEFLRQTGATGSVAGLNAKQLTALGATYSSLGAKIDQSATSINKFMIGLQKNAETVARTVGMSAVQLRKMIEDGDTFGALQAVADRIHQLGESGQNLGVTISNVLKAIGGRQNAQMTTAMSLLVQNAARLREELDYATDAYEKGTLMGEEYARMQETVAGQMSKIGKEFKDAFVNPDVQGKLAGIVSVIGWFVHQLLTLPGILAIVTAGVWKLVAGLAAMNWETSLAGRMWTGLIPALKGSVLVFWNMIKVVAGVGIALVKLPIAIVSLISPFVTLRKASEWTFSTMINGIKGIKAALASTGIMLAVMAIVYGLTKVYEWFTKIDLDDKTGAKWSEATNEAANNIRKMTEAQNKLVEQSEKVTQVTNRLHELEAQTGKTTEELYKMHDEGVKLNEVQKEQIQKTEEQTHAQQEYEKQLKDFNTAYSSYLGFQLTDITNSELVAAAHEKIAAALRSEAAARAAAENEELIREEYKEDIQTDTSDLYTDIEDMQGKHWYQRKKWKDGVDSAEMHSRIIGTIDDMIEENFTKNLGLTIEEIQKKALDAVDEDMKQFLKEGVGNFRDLESNERNIEQLVEGKYNRADKLYQNQKELKRLTSEYDAQGDMANLDIMQQQAKDLREDFDNPENFSNKGDEARTEYLHSLSDYIQELNKIKEKKIAIDAEIERLTSLKEEGKATQEELNKIDVLKGQSSKYEEAIKSLNDMRDKAQNAYTQFAETHRQILIESVWGKNAVDLNQMGAEQVKAAHDKLNEVNKIIKEGTDLEEILGMLRKGEGENSPFFKIAAQMEQAVNGASAAGKSALEIMNIEQGILDKQDEIVKAYAESKHINLSGNLQHPSEHDKNKWKSEAKDKYNAYIKELDDYYVRQQMVIEENRAKGLMIEEEYNARTEKLEREHRENRAKLRNQFLGGSMKLEKKFNKELGILTKEQMKLFFDENGYDKFNKTRGLVQQLGDAFVDEIKLKSDEDRIEILKVLRKAQDELEKELIANRPFEQLADEMLENLDKTHLLFGNADFALGNEHSDEEYTARIEKLFEIVSNVYRTGVDSIEHELVRLDIQKVFGLSDDEMELMRHRIEAFADKYADMINSQAKKLQKRFDAFMKVGHKDSFIDDMFSRASITQDVIIEYAGKRDSLKNELASVVKQMNSKQREIWDVEDAMRKQEAYAKAYDNERKQQAAMKADVEKAKQDYISLSGKTQLNGVRVRERDIQEAKLKWDNLQKSYVQLYGNMDEGTLMNDVKIAERNGLNDKLVKLNAELQALLLPFNQLKTSLDELQKQIHEEIDARLLDYDKRQAAAMSWEEYANRTNAAFERYNARYASFDSAGFGGGFLGITSADELEYRQNKYQEKQAQQEIAHMEKMRLEELKSADSLEKMREVNAVYDAMEIDKRKELLDIQTKQVAIEEKLASNVLKHIQEYSEVINEMTRSLAEAGKDVENPDRGIAKAKLSYKRSKGIDQESSEYIVYKGDGTYETKWMTEEERMREERDIAVKNARLEAINDALFKFGEKMSQDITDAFQKRMNEAVVEESAEAREQREILSAVESRIDAEISMERTLTDILKSELRTRIDAMVSAAREMSDIMSGKTRTTEQQQRSSQVISNGVNAVVESLSAATTTANPNGGTTQDAGVQPDASSPVSSSVPAQQAQSAGMQDLQAIGIQPAGIDPGIAITGLDADAIRETYAQMLNMQTRFNEQSFEAWDKNNKAIAKSHANMTASMTQAMNLYGAAYGAVMNDNLDATQKFEMIALQAVGQTMMAMLSAVTSQMIGKNAVSLSEAIGTIFSQQGAWAWPTIAAVTAAIGASMAAATSQIAKSKSEVAQATGASSGRLTTGMLTYATGRYNDDEKKKGRLTKGMMTLSDGYQPGMSYTVDGADGNSYRAKYAGSVSDMGTGLVRGTHFGIFSEVKPETVIDGDTTDIIHRKYPFLENAWLQVARTGSLNMEQMLGLDYASIGKTIDTLSRSGALSYSGMRMPTFAHGNYPYDSSMDRNFAGSIDQGFGVAGAVDQQADIESRNRLAAAIEAMVTQGVQATVNSRQASKALAREKRFEKRNGIKNGL